MLGYLFRGSLVLALFGLGIVAMAIMQNDFNSLPSESSHSDQRSAKLLEKPVEQLISVRRVALPIMRK